MKQSGFDQLEPNLGNATDCLVIGTFDYLMNLKFIGDKIPSSQVHVNEKNVFGDCKRGGFATVRRFRILFFI